MFAASGIGRHIGVDANWGSTTGASPLSSPTRTFRKAGSGTVKFTLSGTGTWKYQKNGGTLTSFTTGQTLAVAIGDTLLFQITGVANGTVTVTDNSNSASVGSWNGISA